jgi:hypothetical protein
VITITPQPLKLRVYQEHGIALMDDVLRSVPGVCLAPDGFQQNALGAEFLARRPKQGLRVLILTSRRILLAQTDHQARLRQLLAIGSTPRLMPVRYRIVRLKVAVSSLSGRRF